MRKAVLLVGVLLLIGCKDPYGACVKASADIGTGIAQGMKTVDSLRVQGLISAQEESTVLDYFEFANGADKAFLTCAQTAHTSGSKAGSFTTCANTFNSSLNNPQELSLLHVSNPQASQNVNLIVNGVTTAVTAIVSALGGS
jgi:hypothetical protein